MSVPTYIIVAADQNNGIGSGGTLPWYFREDMKHFRAITAPATIKISHAVIMGRRTWESIPETFRPLPGRKNFVLSNNPAFHAISAVQADTKNGCFSSLDDALQTAAKSSQKIFIIGGSSLYRESFKRCDITGIYLTKIHSTYECDTRLDEIPASFNEKTLLSSVVENDIRLDFFLYSRK